MELQSLVGLLQHASTVIRPGQRFLHRIYKTCKLGSRPNHWVRLNAEVCSNLVWWHTFAQDWNGFSLLFPYYQSNPNKIVYCDAAGNWSCGAQLDTCWLQVEWVGSLQGDAIHAKEFILMIFAAATWGSAWKGKVVQFIMDNKALVEVINAGYAI